MRSQGNDILTFKWTGYEFSDEIDAFYNINNAHNWNEFQNALKTYGTPALDFVYADTAGNIAYNTAGLIPVRTNLTDEAHANFESNGEVDWAGFIPFAELPTVLNPKQRFHCNS